MEIKSEDMLKSNPIFKKIHIQMLSKLTFYISFGSILKSNWNKWPCIFRLYWWSDLIEKKSSIYQYNDIRLGKYRYSNFKANIHVHWIPLYKIKVYTGTLKLKIISKTLIKVPVDLTVNCWTTQLSLMEFKQFLLFILRIL